MNERIYINKKSGIIYPEILNERGSYEIDLDQELLIDEEELKKDYRKIGENNQFIIYALKI